MNTEALFDAGSPVVSWLWKTSWQASVMIGLVLLLQWVFRRQLGPRWRHGLWLIVVIRLVLPWSPESPISLFNLLVPVSEQIGTIAGSVSTGRVGTSGADAGTRAESGETPPASRAPAVRWVGWVWLTGMVSLAGYLGLMNWRLGRKVRSQRPVTNARVLNLLEDCKQEMRVSTPITVVETPAVTSPALLGFVRPRLLLPPGLLHEFSISELRFLFLHELGHIKRGDVPLNWVATVPLLLHWFNPLVWYACNRMRVDGELACDALALSRMRPTEKQSYGKTLIKLLESFSRPAFGPGVVGILETKNQMKERISMIAKFGKTNQWPVVAGTMVAALALVTLTDAQTSGGGQAAATAGSDQGPPRIVSTSPEVGATEVDPGLKEITVTFDRDMAGGFSWTGGGPEFPPAPEGAKAQWKTKRTCALPVKLEAGKYYRVGINSTSYRNFKSTGGVPALPTAIYFTTRGASEALKAKASKPQIVGLSPKNGAQDVDPGLKELRVTFNVPMGGGFSWTGGGPEFPTIPEGKKPEWSSDHKTCILPVALEPGHTYRLGLNSPSHKNFQSAGGVPLDPVRYTFKTRD